MQYITSNIFLYLNHYQYFNVMNQLTSISENIDALWSLSHKNVIFLDDLPSIFTHDLQTFIAGETLYMRDGKIVVGHNLYRKWLEKIQTKGFDYEIDFK